MFYKLKRFLIGRPLKSEEIHHEKYSVFRGLPILSSDAISSVAYAGEEILWILIPAIGLLSYDYMFYVVTAIIVLLLILVFSYRQTIDSYPNGGGSYKVSKENLGNNWALIAASALIIDYTLTVAVSSSAGTAAMTSAFPGLLPHKISITVLIVIFMAIGNLRGITESSKLFSLPTYLFIFISIIMIIYGLIKFYVLGITSNNVVVVSENAQDITILLLLRAFAAGCTALTGVEAISDGIPNFKEPAQKHAKQVLFFLALVIIVIFGGISYLATLYKAVPSLEKTVMAQVTEQVFGGGVMFYIMQVSTTLILIMAANTAFSDLPLLLSFVAKDGYAPRQFLRRGDRLSYSNGIIALSTVAIALTILFMGETHFLLPLYAVGVFISFTLSQSGMVFKWAKEKREGWRHKAFINGFGAVVTLITAIIIGATKFLAGAWIIFFIIPALVYAMKQTRKHYDEIAEQLSLQSKENSNINPRRAKHFVVPVGGLNKSVIKTLNYAKCLSDDIIAFHVSVDENESERLRLKWDQYHISVPLVIKKSEYREIKRPLMEYLSSDEHPSSPNDLITVVIPQFVVKAWWGNALHNHTAIVLKNTLLREKNIAVITVPYVIKRKIRDSELETDYNKLSLLDILGLRSKAK